MSPLNQSKVPTRKLEIVFVALFVIANLAAPFLLGEVYPITVAPMFSDQPEHYATYEVVSDAGESLDLKRFGLHLVYDGNPPGLGMGIVPSPTLHKFGEVVDEAQLRRHVQKVLQNEAFADISYVVVKQHFVCCQSHCVCREDREFRIDRKIDGEAP